MGTLTWIRADTFNMFCEWLSRDHEVYGLAYMEDLGLKFVQCRVDPAKKLVTRKGKMPVATFHTHPFGCGKLGSCFYQAPSETDMYTFRQLANSHSIKHHIVIGLIYVWIVEIRDARCSTFQDLMESMENLKKRFLCVTAHEKAWLHLVSTHPCCLLVKRTRIRALNSA